MNKIEAKLFMEKAIVEAQSAKKRGDLAFGAVVTDGDWETRSQNWVKYKQDPTKHAELEAIQDMMKLIDGTYVKNLILFSTAEPCLMCLTACYWADIKTVYYGVPQSRLIEVRKAWNTEYFRYRKSPIENKKFAKTMGIKMVSLMEEECIEAMMPPKGGWAYKKKKGVH